MCWDRKFIDLLNQFTGDVQVLDNSPNPNISDFLKMHSTYIYTINFSVIKVRCSDGTYNSLSLHMDLSESGIEMRCPQGKVVDSVNIRLEESTANVTSESRIIGAC